MDGYQYEREVLFPMWNKERMQQHSASNSGSTNTRERLKEIGIELPKDPIEVELNLSRKMLGNPDNFYPELSPDYELMKSTRKSKWG